MAKPNLSVTKTDRESTIPDKFEEVNEMKLTKLYLALLLFSLSVFAVGCGGGVEPYDEEAAAEDVTTLSEEEAASEPPANSPDN